MRPLVSALTLVVILVPVAAALTLPSATHAPSTDATHPPWYSWWQLEERYGDRFGLEAPPAGLTVQESLQYWLTERAAHGRTPAAWLQHAQDTYATAHPTPLPSADLTLETVRLYTLLGIPLTPTLQVDLDARVEALDPAVRDAFAGLVSVIVDGYAEQQPRADTILARVHAGLDVDSVVVQPDERDAMDALQSRILSALLAFRDVIADLPLSGPDADDPVFTDPENLLYLGGNGAGTYAPTGGFFPDPILIVEPDGHDTYTNSAGGACPDALNLLHRCNRLALSIVYDLAGNDTYTHNGLPAAVQGAGSTGGVGMLVDLAGHDSYTAHFTRAGTSPFFQYIDGGAQGFAQGGSALFLDASGDDTYEITVRSTFGHSIWGFGQGFGSLGSLGITADLAGNDTWRGLGLGGVTGDNFQGLYPQGSGFYGGIGILVDLGGGDDTYYGYLEAQTTDYYAQGFGGFGGLGIQYEDGGNDDYYAVEKAHNPWIETLLNCAFGSGSLGGLGIFIDIRGNDSYYGDSIGPRPVMTMNEGYGGIGAGYGAHIDLGGDDNRVILATGAAGSVATGRGHALQHGNIVGNFLDAGGDDVYIGPGSNNAVWLGGTDQDIIPEA